MWRGGWRKDLRREKAEEVKKARWNRPHREQLKLIAERPGESKKEKARVQALIDAGQVSYAEAANKKKEKLKEKGKKTRKKDRKDEARAHKAQEELHSPS